MADSGADGQEGEARGGRREGGGRGPTSFTIVASPPVVEVKCPPPEMLWGRIERLLQKMQDTNLPFAPQMRER